MKNLIILVGIFFCSIQVQAQRGQAIYAELGGAGFFYSINYDTRFFNREDKLGARIGVTVVFDNDIGMPLHVNYLLSEGNHKLEIGAGITAFFSLGSDFRDVIPSGALMYRFQKEDGHFLFRIGISPMYIELDDPPTFAPAFLLFPGISAGYKF